MESPPMQPALALHRGSGALCAAAAERADAFFEKVGDTPFRGREYRAVRRIMRMFGRNFWRVRGWTSDRLVI